MQEPPDIEMVPDAEAVPHADTPPDADMVSYAEMDPEAEMEPEAEPGPDAASETRPHSERLRGPTSGSPLPLPPSSVVGWPGSENCCARCSWSQAGVGRLLMLLRLPLPSLPSQEVLPRNVNSGPCCAELRDVAAAVMGGASGAVPGRAGSVAGAGPSTADEDMKSRLGCLRTQPRW